MNQEEKKAKKKEYMKLYYSKNKEVLAERYKEYRKDYYLENKKDISVVQKDYYQENKDSILQKRKEYYQENRDEIKESVKEYRLDNIELVKESQRERYQKNKDSILILRKEYYQENIESIKEYRKEYYQENIENIKEYNKNYRVNNKESIRECKKQWNKTKRLNDPLYKLRNDISSLIRTTLSNLEIKKSKRTLEIIGCTIEEFRYFLENKFDENMNWENRGTYWHMDHIIPISWATSEEEVYRLSHYTNFQPLYWEDNLIKSNKFSG